MDKNCQQVVKIRETFSGPFEAFCNQIRYPFCKMRTGKLALSVELGGCYNSLEAIQSELLKSCVVVSFGCFITDIRSLRF